MQKRTKGRRDARGAASKLQPDPEIMPSPVDSQPETMSPWQEQAMQLQLAALGFGHDFRATVTGAPKLSIGAMPSLPAICVPGGANAWRERKQIRHADARAIKRKQRNRNTGGKRAVNTLTATNARAGRRAPVGVDGFRMTLPLTPIEGMLCKLHHLRAKGVLQRAFATHAQNCTAGSTEKTHKMSKK